MFVYKYYVENPILVPAWHLRRLGQWDLALKTLANSATDEAAALRAEILVDRHAWRIDDPREAYAAVELLEGMHPVLAAYLTAHLAYWQRIFDLPGERRADPLAGFAEAAQDRDLGPWATFHLATATQYLTDNGGAAVEGFAKTLDHARTSGDSLLESYALRHQAEMMLDSDSETAKALLRRSLILRSPLGVRPQTAAAQAMLAAALGETDEAAQLRAAARHTARELRLTWLMDS